MQVGDRQLVQKAVGVLEALGRLGRESHDDVDPDGGIGQQLPDAGHALGVQLTAIAPPHLAQHEVVAALQRHVEVRHEARDSATNAMISSVSRLGSIDEMR